MNERPAVGASVDLGSNSVHLLVAAITDHRLRPVVDESVFLGLGAVVDRDGHLGPVARADLAAVVAGYASTARKLGASTFTFMGTEPIRRAADGARIVDEIHTASRVPLHILSHEEEAYLTLIGVTNGRPVDAEMLVVDIGGGSSEFCVVGPGRRAEAVGLRIGANRLTARWVNGDPATDDDLAAMQVAADEVLRAAPTATPVDIRIVGGTASNLLKVTAAGPADQLITRVRLAEALVNLSRHSAEDAAERFGVKPGRARVLPAGAVIVEALMRRYGVPRVRVSEAGMREGAILVADHAGRSWRDRLTKLVHGWRD